MGLLLVAGGMSPAASALLAALIDQFGPELMVLPPTGAAASPADVSSETGSIAGADNRQQSVTEGSTAEAGPSHGVQLNDSVTLEQLLQNSLAGATAASGTAEANVTLFLSLVNSRQDPAAAWDTIVGELLKPLGFQQQTNAKDDSRGSDGLAAGSSAARQSMTVLNQLLQRFVSSQSAAVEVFPAFEFAAHLLTGSPSILPNNSGAGAVLATLLGANPHNVCLLTAPAIDETMQSAVVAFQQALSLRRQALPAQAAADVCPGLPNADQETAEACDALASSWLEVLCDAGLLNEESGSAVSPLWAAHPGTVSALIRCVGLLAWSLRGHHHDHLAASHQAEQQIEGSETSDDADSEADSSSASSSAEGGNLHVAESASCSAAARVWRDGRLVKLAVARMPFDAAIALLNSLVEVACNALQGAKAAAASLDDGLLWSSRAAVILRYCPNPELQQALLQRVLDSAAPSGSAETAVAISDAGNSAGVVFASAVAVNLIVIIGADVVLLGQKMQPKPSSGRAAAGQLPAAVAAARPALLLNVLCAAAQVDADHADAASIDAAAQYRRLTSSAVDQALAACKLSATQEKDLLSQPAVDILLARCCGEIDNASNAGSSNAIDSASPVDRAVSCRVLCRLLESLAVVAVTDARVHRLLDRCLEHVYQCLLAGQKGTEKQDISIHCIHSGHVKVFRTLASYFRCISNSQGTSKSLESFTTRTIRSLRAQLQPPAAAPTPASRDDAGAQPSVSGLSGLGMADIAAIHQALKLVAASFSSGSPLQQTEPAQCSASPAEKKALLALVRSVPSMTIAESTLTAADHQASSSTAAGSMGDGCTAAKTLPSLLMAVLQAAVTYCSLELGAQEWHILLESMHHHLADAAHQGRHAVHRLAEAACAAADEVLGNASTAPTDATSAVQLLRNLSAKGLMDAHPCTERFSALLREHLAAVDPAAAAMPAFGTLVHCLEHQQSIEAASKAPSDFASSLSAASTEAARLILAVGSLTAIASGGGDRCMLLLRDWLARGRPVWQQLFTALQHCSPELLTVPIAACNAGRQDTGVDSVGALLALLNFSFQDGDVSSVSKGCNGLDGAASAFAASAGRLEGGQDLDSDATDDDSSDDSEDDEADLVTSNQTSARAGSTSGRPSPSDVAGAAGGGGPGEHGRAQPPANALRAAAIQLLLHPVCLKRVTLASTLATPDDLPEYNDNAAAYLVQLGVRPEMADAIAAKPTDTESGRTYMLNWALLLAHMASLRMATTAQEALCLGLREVPTLVPDLLDFLSSRLPLTGAKSSTRRLQSQAPPLSQHLVRALQAGGAEGQWSLAASLRW